MGTTPDSLDPGAGYSPQALEADWLAYTPLLTYAHASGAAGTRLIPGLASALPTVSDDGLTYTLTLRTGLVYSNGRPVRASDFARAVERALRIPWVGAAELIAPQIKGAMAFYQRKAQRISGVSTDDATRRITIHLNAPSSMFENLIASPALAPIPRGTSFSIQSSQLPPGVGPYKLTGIVPGQSFSLVKNRYWRRMRIPGIPAGHLNIDVRISPDLATNARAVLNNTADVFDSGDTIPATLVPRITTRASDRYTTKVVSGTYYIFENTQSRPFSSQLAREAVTTALDRGVVRRLASGNVVPGCYLLPPTIPGHPPGSCPYGDPFRTSITKARALVEQSGMAGTPVTVWSETRLPQRRWMTYYTSLLKRIGFKAREKTIPDADYFTEIHNPKVSAQTGFSDWSDQFPNPLDFYALVTSGAMLPAHEENVGHVHDPFINRQVARLARVPSSKLGSVASEWAALDEYTARKGYVPVLGYPTFPQFVSNRIQYAAIVFHPVAGLDWSSFRLQ
jgi:peptide/nickel transport system substrate-binding protein